MLVPVDADVDCERQQVVRGVLVDEVLEALAGARQKIVVLDACRNNPLGEICPPATKAKLTFRDFKVPDAGNFLLVSSTKPGQVADDGLVGAHSPFARALLAALSGTPNVHFDQVFNRVAKTVIEETSKGNFTQIPEMLIRGGAPEACLAGAGLRGRSASGGAREELAALKRDRARDQELGETAKEYLAQIEKARGKPLSEDERRRSWLRSRKPPARWPRATTIAASTRWKSSKPATRARRSGCSRRTSTPRRPRRRPRPSAAGAAQESRRFGEEHRRAGALERRGEGAGILQARRGPRPGRWQDMERLCQRGSRCRPHRRSEGGLRAGGAESERRRRAKSAYWAPMGLAMSRRTKGTCPCVARLSSRLAIADFAKADPNNAGWQRDLSVSYDRVGDVLVAQGNLPEALKSYQGSLAIADRLAKADPNNAGWQRDLSVSYNKVGDVLVAQGNLPEALKSTRAASRFETGSPRPTRTTRAGSAISRSPIQGGDVLVAQGNLPEALKSYQGSLAIADRLAKADPNNAGWQRDLSVSYNRVGDVLVAQGNLPEALKSYQGSLAIETGRQGRPEQRGLAARSLGLLRQGGRCAGGAGKPARGAEILPGQPRDCRPARQGRPEQRRLAARSLGLL